MRAPEIRRRARLLLLPLLVLLSAVGAEVEAEPAARPGLDELVQLFDDVAFGREMEDHPAANRRLIKWTEPVRIGLERIGGRVSLEDDAGARIERVVMQSEPVPATARATLARHARALRGISGHDIALAGAGETPNLWVTFTTVPFMGRLEITGVTRDLLKRLAAPGRCYFVSFAGRDGAIRRAHVVANRLLPEKALEHCLLEELAQALGLPNDSERLRPSIFSDRDSLTALSEADALLLAVLYDPLMKAGTPREAALWRAEGLFRKRIGGNARPAGGP